MHSIKAVFFDLDGTLVDSTFDISNSVNELRNELKSPPLSHEKIIGNVGKGAKYLLSNTLPAETDIEAVFPRFIEIYKKNTENYSVMYDGVKELLEDLKDFKKVLITNKPGTVTEIVLNKHDIKKYFNLVFSAESLPKKKPDPYPLLHAAEVLGLQKEEVIYVGDGIDDYLACRAAGIRCVIAKYGYGVGFDGVKPEGAYFIEAPQYLMTLILHGI